MPLTAFSGTERFELIRRLGEGGFGIVYEALDRKRSARVALKVLREAEGTNLYRFKREFRALADISHENLVGLDELLTDGHHWFFTMELVNGVSLVDYARPIPSGNPADRRRRSDGVLDEARVRATLPQLVAALNTIHRLGIVHCDIKPSNVLVTPDGRVVVLDFGLVSENVIESDDVDPGTWNMDVLGTPAYMAPEQVIPGAASSASDWYSVGVMLYQTLTGQLPFAGSNVEILEAKQDLQPRPPSDVAPNVPKDLSALVMKLLEPDPLRRPAADVLIRYAGNPSVPVAADAATTGTEVLVGRDRQLEDLTDAFDTATGRETVVALVSGASGMGKTALVRHFLNEQRFKEPAMLALTGRCYERESMPYKAIDPLIDALAQHLQRLRNIEVARLLPRDVGILARLFPVLMGVEEIRRAPHPAIDHLDSLAVRRRAAEALRDLLCALGERAPLVLFIDDVQWGDADSAAILQQVLRQPDGPTLLLIAACRSEDAASAVLVRSLRETAPSQIRDVGVDRLSQREARDLATQLISGGEGGGPGHAEAIARHAAGSPLFVHQIAQHAIALGTPMRFDALVRERIDALSEGAQDLMTAVSLSAQPIPPEVAEAAAGLSGKLREPLQLLRASRLVRTDASADRQNIESYHDRIREAVVTDLGSEQLQDWHTRLATAWEQSGLARPETLVTHYRAAGDDAKTTEYAQVAAERATTALAFDRAAEFFELLASLERNGARKREWLEKRGDALVNAGEGRKAADAFRGALEFTTDEDMAIRLQTRQAAELIRAAYVEDAMVVLRSLLPKVGVRVPENDAQAYSTLKQYDVLLRIFGTRLPKWFVRPGKRGELLRRVNVLAQTSAPLCFVSLVQGNALNVQAVWHAARSGEPRYLVMALTGLSALESVRGTRSMPRALDLIAQAEAIANPLGDPWMKGRTQLASGICYKATGNWKEGVERLETSMSTFSACTGVRWEIESAQMLRHDALYWMGEWDKLARELPARLAEAVQRGDQYSITHVVARFSPVITMAADQVERARKEVDDSRRHLPKGFHLQHRLEVCARVDVELYGGNPAAAADCLAEAWPKLQPMVRVWQNGRIEMLFYRARIALALAAHASNDSAMQDALTRAHDDAAMLDLEAPWASALASLVRIAVDHARHQEIPATIASLDACGQQLRACHMHHYAAAADYRRGMLMDSSAGRDLVKSASEWMTAHNMMNAAKMADLLAPGPWTRRDLSA